MISLHHAYKWPSIISNIVIFVLSVPWNLLSCLMACVLWEVVHSHAPSLECPWNRRRCLYWWHLDSCLKLFCSLSCFLICSFYLFFYFLLSVWFVHICPILRLCCVIYNDRKASWVLAFQLLGVCICQEFQCFSQLYFHFFSYTVLSYSFL